LFNVKRAEPKTIIYRDKSETAINNLYSALQAHDFTHIVDCADVDEAMLLLDSVVLRLFHENCPRKSRTISPKDNSKPWITPEIKTDIRKRQSYDVLSKMGKMDEAVYKRFRNFVTNKIRTGKVEYYSLKFGAFKNDLQKTWSIINDILKPASTVRDVTIESIVMNGIKYEDKIEICDQFNEHFATVGRNIADSIHSVNPNEYMKYLTGDFVNSFFFSPVSAQYVGNVIFKLKNKNCQLDELPVRILKKLS
jgi:hypothetical protein